MRGRWFVVLAGCYAPSPPPGAACGAMSACPTPLVCAPSGTCEVSGSTDAPGSFEYIELEAEAGSITPAMLVVADAMASNGAYVVDNNGVGLSGPGTIEHTFRVGGTATRDFTIWGRTFPDTDAADSFNVSIDGDSDKPFRTCVYGLASQWRWVPITPPDCPPNLDCCTTVPRAFSLAPGTHSLVFRSREGGTRLDRLVVTDDPSYVPAD